MARRVLLVDGYNLIRQTPVYRDLDLDAARAALVSDVASYAASEWDATIVFDGGNNPHSQGLPHRTAGITVIFSKYGTEADAVIEGLARVAREHGDTVEVVTSDAQTQWAVLGGTVARRSSAEFSASLRERRDEWGEANPTGSAKSTVSERIDPDVRDILSRWAKGQK